MKAGALNCYGKSRLLPRSGKGLQNQIDQIQQRLLPPPRQGIIERIAEALARLRRPKGSA